MRFFYLVRARTGIEQDKIVAALQKSCFLRQLDHDVVENLVNIFKQITNHFLNHVLGYVLG